VARAPAMHAPAILKSVWARKLSQLLSNRSLANYKTQAMLIITGYTLLDMLKSLKFYTVSI